jgi:hypothetical protein
VAGFLVAAHLRDHGARAFPTSAAFVRRLRAAWVRTAPVSASRKVEAGRRGGFGLVVALDRGDQAAAPAALGADLVADDLGRLGIQGPTVRQGGR